MNTPFRTKYTNRPKYSGQSEFEPSITVPDCSFNLHELINQYAIGSLPSMAELQPWIHDSYDEDDTSNDFGFGSDRAGMLEQFLEANRLRRDIYDKVVERYKVEKAKNPEFTEKDATTFDGIDLNEV